MKRLFAFVTVTFAAILLAASCNLWPQATTPTATQALQPSVDGQATESKQQSFFYNGIAGETAMDALKKFYTVETKDFGSGMGEFVVSINGIKPASDEFWAFYVNGKSSTVGASTYVAKPSDLIEWRLEKIRN